MNKSFSALCILVLLLCSCSNSTSTNIITTTPTPLPSVSDIIPSKSPSKEPASSEPTTSEGVNTGGFTISKEEFPEIDGTIATQPLSHALYESLTGATKEEAQDAITHCAYYQEAPYERLINGEVDMILTIKPYSHFSREAESHGITLIAEPIAQDALVFVANAANPIKELTTEQIIDIYSGKISNWSKLGGQKGTIIPFQLPEYSAGDFYLNHEIIIEDPLMKPPDYNYGVETYITRDMARYDNKINSLAYSSFYYETFMSRQPDRKFLKIDGVEPSLESIHNQSYPYIMPYYAIIRSDEDTNSVTHQLFDWLTGEEGQTLIASLGYIPADPNMDLQTELDETLLMSSSSLLKDDTTYTEKIFAFEDNERLILNPSKHTIFAMDNKGNITNRLYNVFSFYEWRGHDNPITEPFILNENVPLLLSTSLDYLDDKKGEEDVRECYGAYNLLKNEWIVPLQTKPLYLTARYIYSTDAIYDYQGIKLLKAKEEFRLIGNTVYVKKSSSITYYDKKTLHIKQVEDLDHYKRQISHQDYTYDIKSGNSFLYDLNGENVFDAITFVKNNKLQEQDITGGFFQWINEDTKSALVEYNKTYYITDLEGNIKESVPEHYKRASKDMFFWYENDCLHIVNITSGKKTTITGLELPSDMFLRIEYEYPYTLINNGVAHLLYYGNTLLSSCDSYQVLSDNCVALYQQNTALIYVNADLKYTSLDNESVYYANDDFIATKRGNVFTLSDYNGNIYYQCYDNTEH